MALVRATASTTIDAPPERVLELLRDYTARPTILTGNYSQCRVEAGGSGAGTLFAYHFSAGGRERDYRLKVEEEDQLLRERDELSSFVCTWRVTPSGTGSDVSLTATWQGASGIGGIFEGLFAPLGLRRIYGQILGNLATAARA
jgi:hypothetical protein